MSINDLKFKKYPVLDQGFICLVDAMGDDSSIVQAARVSYNKDNAEHTDLSDRNLIRYLMSHSHCYAPWMQVLTARGWIRWDDCRETELYAVPNPKLRSITFEECETVKFKADEGLHLYDNARMSYAVTPNHRMYFKSKYQNEYQMYKAEDMPNWGHFDPLQGYSVLGTEEANTEAHFIGFYLGDGCFASTNRITFHIRKDRKKAVLTELCEKLNLDYTILPSSTYPEDGVVYTIVTPEFVKEALGVCLMARAKDKQILKDMWRLNDRSWCMGIYLGLVGTDGSFKEDRPQVNFSSTSKELINLFQAVSSVLGFNCHSTATQKDDSYRCTSYYGERTTLEARKQYFSFAEYEGDVFCCTTSTGLLLVRGGEDKYAFVCGNSTPFEMVEIKFMVQVPMDCWRQWIRHRTANVNEYSTRYTEAIDMCQTTDPSEWRLQATDNKQGSDGFLTEYGGINSKDGKYFSQREQNFQKNAQQLYLERIESGIAKEQARKDLPLSTYTRAYWKCDLHNIFNFLRLRMDLHAQYEIRMYANAMYEIVKQIVPVACEAFEDYVLNAKRFSAMELDVLRKHLEMCPTIESYDKPESMSKREWTEFLKKVSA